MMRSINPGARYGVKSGVENFSRCFHGYYFKFPLPSELSIMYFINSSSRLQKPRREPDAHCDAPTLNPDDRASMTIWVQILAEVRPELESFMALQNEPPLMA
jgi:hypothetical protein